MDMLAGLRGDQNQQESLGKGHLDFHDNLERSVSEGTVSKSWKESKARS
jgi:hypothetical protein